MIPGHAPQRSADTRTDPESADPEGGSVGTPTAQGTSGPRARTADLIAGELGEVRQQLDQSLVSGDLGLAAECSFELEQLRIELAALVAPRG